MLASSPTISASGTDQISETNSKISRPRPGPTEWISVSVVYGPPDVEKNRIKTRATVPRPRGSCCDFIPLTRKTQTLTENRTRLWYARAASLAMLCLIRYLSWTLDLFFDREIEQMTALREVEDISELAARIRARAKPAQQRSAAFALANSAHGQ